MLIRWINLTTHSLLSASIRRWYLAQAGDLFTYTPAYKNYEIPFGPQTDLEAYGQTYGPAALLGSVK